ncbi:hypothetical protein M569_04575, partial [Genlisea aurea]
ASYSSSPQSNSHLQSPFYSFSEPSSTPFSRTLSLPTPLVHHPALRKGDSNHFVALTSSTYGSLVLVDPPKLNSNGPELVKVQQDIDDDSESPSSPDSVINTWELMEGLDEEEFSFQMVDYPQKDRKRQNDFSHEIVEDHPVSKPLWKHLSEESLLAKMDYNVVSSYRKALQGNQNDYNFHRQVSKNESLSLHPVKSSEAHSVEFRCLSNAEEDKIVVYYTSLRGIRKTYEDCCAVRAIIRGFRVCVDEKDISMDRSYKTELQEALKGKHVSLPQVFIRGKCIGGAEVIKQLNEAGELAKLLEGFPVTDIGIVCCEVCGDARFVPCPNCNGSRKVYEEEDGKLRRCPDCNENGLIRCSSCC